MNKSCVFCNGSGVFLGASGILYRCYCVKPSERIKPKTFKDIMKYTRS